jgi:hypothetical protein
LSGNSITFREREEKVGVSSERHYRDRGGGIIETEFGSFEGSQAVPASPPGKGEASIRDLFNFDFKDVGAAVVGEM